MLQRKLINAGLTGGTSIGDIVPSRVRDQRSWSTLNPIKETEKIVVREVTHLGLNSYGCRRVPVSLPRVTFIDGPFA